MAAEILEEEEGIISSINITPLVDIFLVLLIIFMITSAVVDQREIKVSLPKAAHAGDQAPKASGLVLDQAGMMYLDGQPSDSAAVADALHREASANPDYQVLIAADQELPYRTVVKAIDLVRGSGISKYALKVVRQAP
ncbi:MAG: Biopolymer transport protein ExbD/TolR [Fibrobacteres bacterium]|nr:Biopolymer transport protein ExbD/TolR [Fibrobacterota bacterium]